MAASRTGVPGLPGIDESRSPLGGVSVSPKGNRSWADDRMFLTVR